MKRKPLSLVTALLLSASMLVSCTGDGETPPVNDPPVFESQLNSVINPDFTSTSPHLISSKTLSISGDLAEANDGFAIFTDSSEDGTRTTRVFSHYTNEVIKTYTDTATARYYVDLPLFEKSSVFAVASVTVKKAEDFNQYYTASFSAFGIDRIPYGATTGATVTITFFDAKGNELTALDPIKMIDYNVSLNQIYQNSAPYGIADNLFCINGKVYTDDNGSVFLIRDGKTESIPDRLTYAAGTYYYSITSTRITVYDKSLNPVSFFAYPTYATQQAAHILNNGDLILQYLTKCPDDTTDFDLYNGSAKYTLTTLHMSAESGTTRTMETNAMLISVITAQTVAKEEGDGYLAENVENIATVSYIDENKQIDHNVTALDFLSLGNDGSVKGSLSFGGAYVGLPTILQKGVYSASTAYGSIVTLNTAGDVLFRYDPDLIHSTSAYFYNESAIYDLIGNLLYDCDAQNVTSVVRLGATNLLITTEKIVNGATVTEYYLFNNGTATLLGVVGGDVETIRGLRYGSGYFAVFTVENKCVLYNEFGTKLLELNATLLSDLTFGECRDGYLITLNGVYYKLLYDVIE